MQEQPCLLPVPQSLQESDRQVLVAEQMAPPAEVLLQVVAEASEPE